MFILSDQTRSAQSPSIQEVTSGGAEACKESSCCRRTLADSAFVAGDRIQALQVSLVHGLHPSVHIRRAGMALCEATPASMLIISSRHTRALELALLPLEVLLALGTTLTEEVLACLQYHNLHRNESLLSQDINPNGAESHRSMLWNEAKTAAPRGLSLAMVMGQYGMGKYGMGKYNMGKYNMGKYSMGTYGMLSQVDIVQHRHMKTRFCLQGHSEPVPKVQHPIQFLTNHLCPKRRTAGM